MPDRPFTAPLIGPPLNRLDGHAKVTGSARYATDQVFENLAHGVFVESSITAGRIKSIDIAPAQAVAGVLAILTHENAPRLQQVGQQGQSGRPGQSHMVLQDERIFHAGQYVALVIAESIDVAEYAATLIRVAYQPEDHQVLFENHLDQAYEAPRIPLIGTPPVTSERGDADAVYRRALVRLDLTYRTPVQHHVPLEAHGTTAVWNGDEVTIYDSTQHVYGVRSVVAKYLGIPEDKVRAISSFTGGAFGSKGSSWPHITFAAVAARQVGRPVRIWLSRRQSFVGAGHRAPTLQQIRIGADRDGRLLSLVHEATAHTSPYDDFCDAIAVTTRTLYSCPNLRTAHHLVKVNINTPTAMRAPGEAPGLFALESAMDELADAVDLDPLELRLRNYAKTDEDEGKAYTSKALLACYGAAAERFGWSARPRQPRSLRDGRWLIGQGMASAIYPGKQSPASARVRLLPDGRAEVASATHELGTGGWTAMTMIAAEALGIPVDQVTFRYGDTHLPNAPVSAGSQSVACVGSAIKLAADKALAQVIALAVADPSSSLYQVDPAAVDIRGADLIARGTTQKEAWPASLTRLGSRGAVEGIEANATYQPPKPDERPSSAHAFGAHFCEVRVAEDTGEVQVSRWTAGFGCGRIINAKTAHSQLIGAIVWGIGMALHEETSLDPHLGRFMNRDLAEYLVPVSADIPHIDAFFVEENDPAVDPIGAKNVGEIGICGAAAAIANAVYHATGKRVRDLPIRIEKIL